MPRAAFVSDMWRAPAAGMARTPDAKAERIRAKKDAKLRLRSLVAALVTPSAQAQTFRLLTPVMAAVSEECADCLKLNRRTA